MKKIKANKINVKKITAVLFCASILSSFMLTGCAQNDINTDYNNTDYNDAVSLKTEETQAVEQAKAASETAQEVISDNTDTGDYTAVISLNGTSADVEGSGVSVDGGRITVSEAGTYFITGTLNDGRIIVDAQGEDVVLVLSGASITCSYSSPVYIYKSSSTTIVLEENTVSTLSDGTAYDYSDSYSSESDSEPNACLYSKSDLMITGNGRLNINAVFNNGITGKDTLQIVYADVYVSSVNNGITGKDCVILSGAQITVECSGNGIMSSNDTDAALGYITATDSSLDINCEEDGIDAQTTLTIADSTVNIVTTGTASDSCKGLKADSILINSGTFSINTTDDAIHSNGDVNISGGSFSISSGDDGIHADDSVTISNGDINITDSYEGIEGTIINIAGGTININASDDGMNAAGGADQSGYGGFADSFTSSGASINISGGITYINAQGDGIDSNGSLNVTDGEVYVSGPTNNGNGAIDYQGTGTITGGIVAAAGSSGMALNFGNTSTQGSILANMSGSAGDTVTLTDSEGTVIISFTAQKNFECIVLSCPQLEVGETYTISSNSSSINVTLSSLIYGQTGMSGMSGMVPQGGMEMNSANQPGGGTISQNNGNRPDEGMTHGQSQPEGNMNQGEGGRPNGMGGNAPINGNF